MQKISSIPYESIEDLNKFIYDNYYSTEQIESSTTGTGTVTAKIFELTVSTGVTQNSISTAYYSYAYFNPLYAEAIWKCYVNSMDDCFVFFGFKETTSEPTYDMIESHAGFMIYDGKLYASVADGFDQQRVEIVGIDLTRVENYKIEYDKFYIMPLPEIEEQLGMPGILSTFPTIKREWKKVTELSNFPPKNQVHNLIHFIKNTINADKIIYFNRFIYKEVYAD